MLDPKQLLDVVCDAAVAIITLDRPKSRNALCSDLVAQLIIRLKEVDGESDVRCIVLCGSPPGFCAGSDLKELAALDAAEMCSNEAATAAAVRSIAHLSKPVVAAVEGFAIGGGFVLAAACDLVVTNSVCRWHLPEVALGWVPPWGLEALTARVGAVTARRLTWGCDPLDGTEAWRLGIADYLAPTGSVKAEAVALGKRIAALPVPAVGATKRFYASLVSATAECRDAEANRLFRENCQQQTASVTFQDYKR